MTTASNRFVCIPCRCRLENVLFIERLEVCTKQTVHAFSLSVRDVFSIKWLSGEDVGFSANLSANCRFSFIL